MLINFIRSFTTHSIAKNPPSGRIQNVIKKILIANRGEIACRVIRTARRLGIRTVAVYSDIDENSLHTKMADEAFNIGAASSQESYLRGDKIIDVAKRSNCQAIHPGYGFLSENVEFAELCDKEDVIFIGPSSSAIRDMGIKSTSKKIMSAAGVPVINGYHGEDQSDQKLQNEANKIGYPLMIKAVRGGGGKGMRVANDAAEFMNALNSARNESSKAFGDSSVLLERFVRSPRHVEVQIFGDRCGNTVYLFERDCSVQRRHQKIIEEAPAPGITESLRKDLGEAAVCAAKAVGYVGAGTVEFILDKEDLSFHFMEMNTRLQVEHPITEMITGTDLVEWQLKVAAGEPLPLTQEEIECNGHAFEARIYAEDPRGGFLPGAGPLKHLTTPDVSKNVRVETGVVQGDEVSVHYDPMIAKLVVWGENRQQALKNLLKNLENYHICGLETNVNFLMQLASNEAFQDGDVHTGFIEEHHDELFPAIKITGEDLCQAALALLINDKNSAKVNSLSGNSDPFILAGDFRLNHDHVQEYKLIFNQKKYTIQLKMKPEGILFKTEGSKEWKPVKFNFISGEGKFTVRFNMDGHIKTFYAFIGDENVTIFNENGKKRFVHEQPKFLTANADAEGSADSRIVCPMPGVLEKVFVKAGDNVKKGAPLAVVIAMKMEHVLKAPKSGKIKSVNTEIGSNLKKGAVIVVFEEEEDKKKQ